MRVEWMPILCVLKEHVPQVYHSNKVIPPVNFTVISTFKIIFVLGIHYEILPYEERKLFYVEIDQYIVYTSSCSANFRKRHFNFYLVLLFGEFFIEFPHKEPNIGVGFILCVHAPDEYEHQNTFLLETAHTSKFCVTNLNSKFTCQIYILYKSV